MNPAHWSQVVAAGFFTLAGATLGFVAAIVTELLRNRAASKRDARVRREQFQIETLTRLQTVSKEVFIGIMREYVGRKREFQSGEVPHLTAEDFDLKRRVIDAAADIVMLAYRCHDTRIGEAARSLIPCIMYVVEATGVDDLEEQCELARSVEDRLQDLSGREIIRILDGGEVTPRSQWPPDRLESEAVERNRPSESDEQSRPQ